MSDLLFFYIAEREYLKLFLLSIVPILMAPLVILMLTRALFYWYDPNLKMTPTKMFMFVSIAVIISLTIMLSVLYIILPHGTDFRLPLLFTLLVFGLLGAGRLYLVEADAPVEPLADPAAQPAPVKK